MCSIPSIKLLVVFLTWIKLAFTIYIFGIGIYFASSLQIQRVFGVQFLSHGLSLIFLSLLSFALIYPMKFGVFRHNRFLLVVVFLAEIVILSNYLNIGFLISHYTAPLYSKDLQLDCLRKTPKIYTEEQCSGFYHSDRTAGLRLLWADYFYKNSDKAAFQTLSNVQGGLCCGFFPPFKCVEDTRKYPENRTKKGIKSSFLEQRVMCGYYPNYYPVQDNCYNYYDFGNSIIGGCNYDMGVGFCLLDPVEDGSSGCASSLEDYAINLIAPHAILIIVTSAFSLLYIIICTCMWFKRKETDIFPRENEEDIKFKNKVISLYSMYQSNSANSNVYSKPGKLYIDGRLPPVDGVKKLEAIIEENDGKDDDDDNGSPNGNSPTDLLNSESIELFQQKSEIDEDPGKFIDLEEGENHSN